MSARPCRAAGSTLNGRFQLLGLATANAAAVASLYWNQSLSRALADDFPQDLACLSIISGITLAGYATGVTTLAFGPATHRRFSVGLHMGLLALSLTIAGVAPSALMLAIASFFVGCGAAVAQRLLAIAAQFGGAARAGTAIGRVICAALIAVLSVRLVGEAAASFFGWRTIFLVAAATVCFGGLLHYLGQLSCAPPQHLTVASPACLVNLWRSSIFFRRAVFQQGMVFAAYSGAWILVLIEIEAQERLPVVMSAGAVGVAAALLAGRYTDTLAKHDLGRAGAAAVLVASGVILPVAYNLVPGLPRTILLSLGMALLDAGLQIALVANQAGVQALAPASRGRLAAFLTVCGSSGSAFGAAITYLLWQRCGLPQALGSIAVSGLLGFGCSLLCEHAESKPSTRVADTTRAEGEFTLEVRPTGQESTHAFHRTKMNSVQAMKKTCSQSHSFESEVKPTQGGKTEGYNYERF